MRKQEPETKPRVVASVLNWNGWRDTIECLTLLQQTTYPEFQIVVVDNGSEDGSVEKIKEWARENLGKSYVFVEYAAAVAKGGGEEEREELLESAPPRSRLVLIVNEENLGFSGGHNIGINYAVHRKYPADYVFLLSNDTRIERNCLTALVDVAQKTKAGIVGVLFKDRNGNVIPPPIVKGNLVRPLFSPVVSPVLSPPETEDNFWFSLWVDGAAMFISKDVLAAVYSQRQRYLNSGLFLDGEELDLCFLAHKLGYKIAIAKKAIALCHKGGESIGGRRSALTYYYQERSRLLLAGTLLSTSWKILFYPVNASLAIARISKNLVHGRFNLVRAIFCGVVDGYRGVTGKWKRHDEESEKMRSVSAEEAAADD